MRALDRKLARDLWRHRGQVATISLVVACGISQLVAFATMYRSLAASRDAYYAAARFADLFVHLERAPRSVLGRLAEVPGVARVEGRAVGDYRLSVPGSSEPVLGHFVSLEGPPGARLNEVVVKEGRGVEPGAPREVVLSELFARARGLRPGDTLEAVLEGREARLEVVGIGSSPEFVWAPNPRSGLPDAEHFGVVWMDGRALSTALGLSGAFNDAVLQLTGSARPAEVAAAVERLLEPYGAFAVLDRAHQASNQLLANKLAQYRSLAVFVPALFLAVAAFLVNLVISRLVGTQREQIATLKALGYGTGALARHYLGFALAICLVGALLGVGVGVVEGDAGVRFFCSYFNLPPLAFRPDASGVAAGVLASAAAATMGATFSVLRTVRLPAAEAMQPEPPEEFRPTVVERLHLDRLLGVAARMVLRDIERRPLRTALSALAVALATAIVLVGYALLDSLDRAVEVQYTRVEREDLAAALDRPRSASAVRSIAGLPGVDFAEAQRVVPVRLRAGHRERQLALLGLPADPVLRLPRDNRARAFRVAPSGLTLSSPLQGILGVRVGDEVEVEELEAGRRRFTAPVVSFVDDFVGLNAYMDLRDLERRLWEPPTVTGVLLSVDRSRLGEVMRRMERLPAVASLSRPDLEARQFVEQEADVLRAIQSVLVAIAVIVAVGIIFNNARIALSVRSRDLATLRILGFTRGEVAALLVGEQAVQLALGIAAGVPLGLLFGSWVLALVPPDLFRLPMEAAPGSVGLSVLVVLLAGLASALLVRREADRLDLVSVLKARD